MPSPRARKRKGADASRTQKFFASFLQKRRLFFSEEKKQKTFMSLKPAPATVHLLKLAVGSQSIEDIRRWQSQQKAPKHRTRNFPRRAEELLDGGSIYWVINRIVSARQRIIDIVEAVREDGTKCTDLMLDKVLVPVQGGLKKPFQGWRYLEPGDAPPDVAEGVVTSAEMPAALRRELAALGLL
jgi:hypothetical protein